MSETAIALHALERRFGDVAAVDGVDLEVAQGAFLVLLGPSGCGKTTALRLLAGLDAPTTGEVLLDGEVISDSRGVHLPPHRRRLTLVFQDLALWPNLTALENVRLGLSGSGLAKRESKSQARAALDLCGVGDLAARRPSELSGGQQQRVALARAIAPKPEYILLDEPFAALDLVVKARLVDELRRLAEAQQATLILVTHDPSDAVSLCPWAFVLDGGSFSEAGPLSALLGEPRSELLRLFRDHVLPRATVPQTLP